MPITADCANAARPCVESCIPLTKSLHDVAVHVQNCFARLGQFATRGEKSPAFRSVQTAVSVDFRTKNWLQHQHSTL